jgi:phosphoribosylglycinamide formyltransferase-1
VLTNNPHAKVLERCKTFGISALSFNRIAFEKSIDVLNILKASKPDLIILAGFLWQFPKNILIEFPNKVINIHPALLPKYGGKGMYGMRVHDAVVANHEKETGITIHYVNENYDEGAVIFQAKCKVEKSDSAIDVAHKIHDLEMEHFPKVIDKLLSENI